MSEALLSTNWYRVADLKPRLRGHIRIHRHAYRGEIWYVVEDRVAGKYHRFNPPSYRVISLMDGKRDMAQVWRRLTEELVEDTPDQEEVIRLLGQLHGADLIQCDVTPDVAELLERRGKQERKKLMSRYLNPMSLRFPLVDPDRFLEWANRWPHLYKGGWGMLIWLAVVLPALFLAPMHWPDLTENFSEQLLAMDNLLLMAVVFPLLKGLHEIGHGLAAKSRGGEVHEMGIMLLVFFPIPYVEASSSSAFVKKTDRMLVGAAGMLTELFIAAIAFFLWLMLEPGLARSLAYNTIILASVTTILFNANPLLRYDGYYVLADWVEIPNLGSRSTQYWKYLAERYLLDVPNIEPPPATPGERRWFIGYAPLAFGYRMFVLFGIALFVAQQYFIVGVLLALWGLVASLGMPLFKIIRALLTEPRFAARSSRIRAVLGGTALLLYVLLFVLPMPYHTHAEGVLRLPEQALLRADAAGFVTRGLARPGDALRPGDPVLESYNPEVAYDLEVQLARLEEVRARYDAAWGVNPAEAARQEEELRREQAAVARLRERMANLTLRAGASGRLLLEHPDDMPGRFLKQGEVVGYVVGSYVPVVRVVVGQEDVDQVRLATREVVVKLPQNLAATWPAHLLREVPAAGHELPSPALGQRGGGDIVLDPKDEEGTTTLQSVFEFELSLEQAAPARYLGSRVHVRFEHPATPLGVRAWRAVRRLFLSQFHV
ncbi:MAG: PqqD family peptide modification chaperone [Gammaproteobacteria bacterium]|nr:PqqD family peptide modification chaperone [Gammaproteobacteria bacterium]